MSQPRVWGSADLVIGGQAGYPGAGVQVAILERRVILAGVVGPGQRRPVARSRKVVSCSEVPRQLMGFLPLICRVHSESLTCCLHSGRGWGRLRGRRQCWLSAACRGWWCLAPRGTRSAPHWTCRRPLRGWGSRGNCWCHRRYHVILLFLFGTRKENLLIEFYNV